MSVNTNSAAVTSAKHRGRNAEGSVRVLGQTAAVAGISGALLLALKAMVLVSPAVLPDTDGLDALGRPNSIVDVNDSAQAPVIFAPASNPIAAPAIGHSERTGVFSPTRPSTIGKVADETDEQSPGPKKPVPAKPLKDADVPKSTVGKATKGITKTADDLLGTDLSGTLDTVGTTLEKAPVVGGVVTTVGGAVEQTGLDDTVNDVATVITAPVKQIAGGQPAASAEKCTAVSSVLSVVTGEC